MNYKNKFFLREGIILFDSIIEMLFELFYNSVDVHINLQVNCNVRLF